ncbi:RNA polymerase sigma factor [Sphingobium lignivorans]|uniref:RNA polymerase sigma-70 factor (ECF subfamily) n=1 Tax=Sphingobium lignivorans TaxID=2735886 RepID=A0ABR6NGL4_9SPHN|nr:sigma-70 family RNA polymerase sigma factor [Sphingobium lignivorans]MBB5986427.1 RNA polymerase sigma-70 factor (ECF subfamily) [Sphingobium lignivorans]
MAAADRLRLCGGTDVPAATMTALNGRFRLPLITYFLRRGVAYADAEDMAQEVLIRTDRHGEGADRIDAYLFGVAANLLADRSRRLAVRMRHSKDIAAVSSDIDVIDPERVLIGRERLAIVTQALQELSERTRTIFMLARFENVSQREIADRLGVSLSTVEKGLAQAIAHLVRRLGDPK